MREVFSFLFALLMVVSTLTIPTHAEISEHTILAQSVYDEQGAISINIGENLTYTRRGNTLIISGTGAMKDFWTSSPPWSEVQNVIIENGVTSIGDYAFKNCKNLTNVVLGNSLVSIGKCAFINCTSLTNVVIPGSVTTVGWAAFSGCTKLESVVISNGIPTIGNSMFGGCTNLTSIVIPSSVSTIGAGAFSGCSNLRDIKFMGAAPEIGFSAFYGVVATAYYPRNESTWTDSVRRNYEGKLTWTAMKQETRLVASGVCGENLTWTLDEDGVLVISGSGKMAVYSPDSSPFFAISDRIKTLAVQEGVTSLGNWAFCHATLLEEATIPHSVIAIGDGTFYACKALCRITIDAGLETIGSTAFWFCEALTMVTLPEGVERIGPSAFYHSGLTHISLPQSITYIGDNAFLWCSNLKEVSYSGSARQWLNLVKSNYLTYSPLTKVVLHLPEADLNEFLFLPKGLQIIESGAFENIPAIGIQIPMGVTQIAEDAFKGSDIVFIYSNNPLAEDFATTHRMIIIQ